MNEEKQITTGEKDSAINMLLNFVQACPHIIPPGIGLEEFVESLNKAAIKYAECNRETPRYP